MKNADFKLNWTEIISRINRSDENGKPKNGD